MYGRGGGGGGGFKLSSVFAFSRANVRVIVKFA